MGYHTSHAFGASADVVFDVLTEPGLIARWLAEDPAVPPHETAGYRTAVCRDGMKLRWDPISGGDIWSGHAAVSALPVGGCVIRVKLVMPGTLRTMIHEVDRIVAQVLRRLDAEAIHRQCQAAPAAPPAPLSDAA